MSLRGFFIFVSVAVGAISAHAAAQIPAGSVVTDATLFLSRAEFRKFVRDNVRGFSRDCPYYAGADVDAMWAPAKKELQAFEEQVIAGPFAYDWQIAEEDAVYKNNTEGPQIECIVPHKMVGPKARKEVEKEIAGHRALLENFEAAYQKLLDAHFVSAQKLDASSVKNFVMEYSQAMYSACAVMPPDDMADMHAGIVNRYANVSAFFMQSKMKKVFLEAEADAKAQLGRERQTVDCMRPDELPVEERRRIVTADFARATQLLDQIEAAIREELKEK